MTISQPLPSPTSAATESAQFDRATKVNASTMQVERTPAPSYAKLQDLQVTVTREAPEEQIGVSDLTPTSKLVITPFQMDTLGLSGKIIFTQATGLWQIDMLDGQSTQLWEPPKGSYLSGLANSPDGDRLVIAYAPPPVEGQPQIGRTGLYITDEACTNRTGDCGDNLGILLQRDEHHTFTTPFWSPDGKWVYYTHQEDLLDDAGNYTGFSMNLNRLRVSGNAVPETLMPYASQPSMSADGSLLAYVSYDIETYARGLWVADPDGSNPRQIVPNSMFGAIAGPQLSPDGVEIAFAASAVPQSSKAGSLTWLNLLLGVRKASAHGWRWEIWKVSVNGGNPVQLTRLSLDSPWPTWSPAGDYLAILRLGGVYLLREDDAIWLGSALGHGQLVWYR